MYAGDICNISRLGSQLVKTVLVFVEAHNQKTWGESLCYKLLSRPSAHCGNAKEPSSGCCVMVGARRSDEEGRNVLNYRHTVYVVPTHSLCILIESIRKPHLLFLSFLFSFRFYVQLLEDVQDLETIGSTPSDKALYNEDRSCHYVPEFLAVFVWGSSVTL